MGIIAASQLQASLFDPELSLLSVMTFTSSPCACVDFVQVLHFSSTFQNRASKWIFYDKLFLDMKECVNACVPCDSSASDPGCVSASHHRGLCNLDFCKAITTKE